MKRVLLLLGIACLVLLIASCNGAGLKSPTSNPLPGSGIDNPLDDPYKDIDANYALDLLPERVIPPSIPTEEPEWNPVFDCLTQDEKCIDEGCVTFELGDFDVDNLDAEFKATFFNPNAENFDKLTVFLIITDTTMGVTATTPDGVMKLDEKDTVEYPYYAFNNDNNPGDNEVPGTMYCYFEREIAFTLQKGCDFHVGYILVPVIDQHDLSYVINPLDPSDEQTTGGGEGRNGGVLQGGGEDKQPETPTTPPEDPDDDNNPETGHGTPPLKSPGH